MKINAAFLFEWCLGVYRQQIEDHNFGLFDNKNVPKAGLEPAQLAPHASETCVSTSFTTSAFRFR